MGINELLYENILYYPSIEFHNPSWVKAALCIWESIYRIVPKTVTPDDDSEIKQAVEEGLIKDIVLEEEDIAKASEEFLAFIDSLSWLPDGLDGAEDEVINLHKEKVDYTLYPYLKELAEKIDGDWLILNSRIANGYMLFLANAISKRRKLPKITDNHKVFAIMPYFEQEGNFDEWVYSCDREYYYSSVIFPTLLPGGITRVEMDQVLRFRQETIQLRKHFRGMVREFADNLKDVESHGYAMDLANSLKNKLEANNRSMLEAAKQRAFHLIPSFLTVGMPTTISTLSLIGMDGDPFKYKNVLNSLYIGAIASIADSSSRTAWNPNCASYYLKLNRRFNDGEGFSLEIPRFDKVFEEFMND